MRRRAAQLLLLSICIAASGCAAPRPWVAPFEREALADPLMSFSRNALMDKHRQHVFDVREGGRGATDGGGGGCGCN